MFELGNNELIYAAEDSFRSSPVVRKWSSAVHCCLAPHFRNGGFPDIQFVRGQFNAEKKCSVPK